MKVPNCLVIIPDGNRRWAKAQGRSTSEGHTQGLLNCRRIAEEAFDRGVQHVVLWGASESNLQKREPKEIEFLYGLLRTELEYRSKKVNQNQVFRVCGLWQRPCDIELGEMVERAHARAIQDGDKVLTLLFGYSGKTEIVYAARRAAQMEEGINSDAIQKHLWTAHVPAVDMVIRTGIEDDPHWSDLLLPWQIQSTQLYFSKTCWPAFSKQELEAAFEDCSNRSRRLGA
jgi:undecaprenyl diphosphate synthase